MTTPDDADWLSPDKHDTLPAPPSTPAPKPPGVWRLDAIDGDPSQHPTLIEATGEPPLTPEAQIYGSGALLAQSSQEVAAWIFTQDGRHQLAIEADGRRRRAS